MTFEHNSSLVTSSVIGQVTTEGYAYDTYISSSQPTENYGYDDELWVGTTQTTFIFDYLPELPENAKVRDAQLYFTYYYHISTGNMAIGAYTVLFDWYESELTYNIANTYNNLGLSVECLGTCMLNGTTTHTESSIYITNAVKSWYEKKELNNFGIALKRIGGTNNSVIIEPFDANGNSPYLVIRYTFDDLPVSNGVYYINNGEFSGCLVQRSDDIVDSDDGNINVPFCELKTIEGQSNQKWFFEYLHNGYYMISNNYYGNINSAEVLGIKEGNENTAYREIIRESFSGDARQQWKITITENGMYKIKPRSSEIYSIDLVMGVGSGSSSFVNGRNVEQCSYNGTDNNYLDEWLIYPVGYAVSMVGIKDDGHDHATCFTDVMKYLSQVDAGEYNGYHVASTDSISETECLNRISSSKVFVSRSHGNYDTEKTYICLNSNGGLDYLETFDIYDYGEGEALVDFSNCEIVLFIGCRTAYSNNGVISLCQAAVDAGADFAIGFTESIGCGTANSWVKWFFYYYNKGYSVPFSCEKASEVLDNANGIGSVSCFPKS